MKAVIGGNDRSADLKAAHVARHAPTNLDPNGARWFERSPVISRFLTIYDRMRDYPGRTTVRRTGPSWAVTTTTETPRLARRLRFLILLPHDAISHQAPRPA